MDSALQSGWAGFVVALQSGWIFNQLDGGFHCQVVRFCFGFFSVFIWLVLSTVFFPQLEKDVTLKEF